MPTFPGGLSSLSTSKADATVTATDHPAHHNAMADEINAIEAELGTNPSAGATTVGARIAVMANAPINVDHAEYASLASGDNWKAALDAAAAAIPSSGGQIYIPPRSAAREVYGIALKSKTELFGGQGSVLKLTSSAPDSPGPFAGHKSIITNALASTTGDTDIVIHDLELDGNLTNNSSTEQTYCIELYGVRRGAVRDVYGHDIRAEVVSLGVKAASPVHNEDFFIERIRGYNCGFTNGGPGSLRQMISLISGRRIQIRGITGQLIASTGIDLEVNNSSCVIENCIVDGVTLYDCNSGIRLTGVVGASVKDNVLENLTMKDGPTTAVNLGYVVEQAARTIVRGFSSDVVVSSNAVAVIDSDDTLVSHILCEGTFSNPSILLSNTDRTLITACALKSSGTPTYAVEESGTCTNTIVIGNPILEGNTARVLLTGAGSMAAGNGGTLTATVASAATITIPADAQFVNVTGTTNITSISATWINRIVTLKFASALTVVKGSNLKIDTSYLTATDDTITLQYDGSNWNEMARSVESRGLKLPVRVAPPVNVTVASPGATLDGVTMAAGDRVLLANQTTASQNGIYNWVAAASAMTRATDSDTAAKLTDSLLVTVDEGTVNRDSIFSLSTNKPITVGTTALRFTRIQPAYTVSSHPAGSAYQPTNSKLENIPRDTVDVANQAALATGTIRVFPMGILRAGDTLANLNFYVGTTASATITNSWGGIARLSDRAVLAISATSTATTAANTKKTFTFGSAFTADKDEVLIGFIMYQATTVPSVLGINHGNAVIMSEAPVVNGTSSTGQTTALAVGATLGAFTADTELIYAFCE